MAPSPSLFPFCLSLFGYHARTVLVGHAAVGRAGSATREDGPGIVGHGFVVAWRCVVVRRDVALLQLRRVQRVRGLLLDLRGGGSAWERGWPRLVAGGASWRPLCWYGWGARRLRSQRLHRWLGLSWTTRPILLHGCDKLGGGCEARVDLDCGEMKREMQLLGDVAVLYVKPVLTEDAGGGGGAWLAPAKPDFNLQVI